MNYPRIGIIGGGPGGLMTAYCLQHAAATPYQLTIFEASERLGGKIRTPRFTHGELPYEAGAAEFYDYTPVGEDPLKELILDLGLSIREMDGGSVFWQGKLLDQLEDVASSLGAAAAHDWRKFDRLAKDLMTPREFYEDDPRWLEGKGAPDDRFGPWLERQVGPQVQGLLQTLIHSDLATEPGQTSLAYGLQNYLMNDPAYMRLYAIEGGNEQLVQELARRIAATVKLQQPVQRVGPGSGGRLRVESQSVGARDAASTALVEEFDYLVLALPSGALQSIEYGSQSLVDALQTHHQRFHHPAHYLRITLLFSRPFWKNRLRGSFCMLDAFDGCCLYDESARQPDAQHGILGWLLGGENAVRHSEYSDEELIAQALDSLPGDWQQGRDYLLEGRVHRWTGAVSAWPGGRPSPSLDSRHQPAPRNHPNLFVVGDYLLDSTLNGVLDSAQYVADWLAAEMLAVPLHSPVDNSSLKEAR